MLLTDGVRCPRGSSRNRTCRGLIYSQPCHLDSSTPVAIRHASVAPVMTHRPALYRVGATGTNKRHNGRCALPPKQQGLSRALRDRTPIGGFGSRCLAIRRMPRWTPKAHVQSGLFSCPVPIAGFPVVWSCGVAAQGMRHVSDERLREGVHHTTGAFSGFQADKRRTLAKALNR